MEKLIEMVKGYPYLYQPQHEDYSNLKLKESTWVKIARDLGYERGDEAREQWKKVRDCHRDALRRQRKRSNKGASIEKKWMYEKEMSFLLPFIGKRTADIVPDPVKVEDDADVPTDSSSLEGGREEESSREIPEGLPVSSALSIQEGVSDSVSPTPLRGFAQYEERDEDGRLAEGLDRENHDDGLYHFFISMYNSTRRLPMGLRCKVKRAVFDAVAQAEEDHLNAGGILV